MMDRKQAEQQLEDAEVVPCWEGMLDDGKQLYAECLAADIPVLLARPEVNHPGHGARVQLCARPDDLPRLGELLRKRWHGMLQAEGVEVPVQASAEGEPEGDPPCPACGMAAPLVNGACSECGLQLEPPA